MGVSEDIWWPVFIGDRPLPLRGEILLNLTLASFDTGFRGNAPLPRVFKPIHGADDMTELEEPNIHNGDISHSNQVFLRPLDPQNRETGRARAGWWVDVRDIAAIHAGVLTTPKAGGERFITVAGPCAWADIYEALNVPFDAPTEKREPLAEADNRKLTPVLGKPLSEIYRPLQASLKGMVDSARERGWNVDLS